MSKYALAGLGVVALVVGLVLLSNQGSRLVLNGSIQKVRLQSVDGSHSVAVADFRLNNPAAYRFEVKDVKVILRGKNGDPMDGTTFRQKELEAFFNFYKAGLGQMYNPLIHAGTVLASGEKADFMVAASFDLPVEELDSRQGLSIHLTAINGKVVTEVNETR